MGVAGGKQAISCVIVGHFGGIVPPDDDDLRSSQSVTSLMIVPPLLIFGQISFAFSSKMGVFDLFHGLFIDR